MSPLAPPKQPITFVPAHAGDIIRIGHDLTLRVMEDGSNTDNRLGVAELILAPHATGPPAHWHEMHDEAFLVTKGTVRFFGAEVKDFQGKMLAEAHGKEAGEKDEVAVDVGVGDYITVGTRAPHTFANPSGEEARFINTFTPAFYVNYFKLMSDLLQVRSHSISDPPPSPSSAPGIHWPSSRKLTSGCT